MRDEGRPAECPSQRAAERDEQAKKARQIEEERTGSQKDWSRWGIHLLLPYPRLALLLFCNSSKVAAPLPETRTERATYRCATDVYPQL